MRDGRGVSALRRQARRQRVHRLLVISTCLSWPALNVAEYARWQLDPLTDAIGALAILCPLGLAAWWITERISRGPEAVWIRHADPVARQVAANTAELAGVQAQIGALFGVMDQACRITGIPVQMPEERKPDLRLINCEGERAS